MQIIFSMLGAFILGIFVGMRSGISVTRKGDGEGHVTIIINIGIVNTTPVSQTGQPPEKRKGTQLDDKRV